MIDRISPTRRPDGSNSGTQRWESLLFCHWEIDPVDLRGHVPGELEIDTFEGRAFVGVVPFKMRNIRPAWLPRWLAMSFYETNVRTYVISNGRPGVYFFSLDASSILAVWAARIGWSLPYYYASMACEQTDRGTVYRSHRRDRRASHSAAFQIGEQLGVSAPDTLEHFLFERYLLFVQRKGVMQFGQVHHEPYDVWTAEVTDIHDGLIESAGLPDLGRMPSLTHYSPGVDVEVFATRPA